jgi:4-methyl-5(b-hydroxyethyl)-thiazole monophosphate biosynthesis
MMEPRVLVLLAQGCEELESVTVIDLLRRAGINVISAGLDSNPVTASRGVVLVPDTTLSEALYTDYEMIVLPGGAIGADNLANDPRVLDLLKKMSSSGKYTCAICAGPIVLAKAGLLHGRQATSYPGCLDNIDIRDFKNTGEAVTRDGKLITSRGPGTAMDFALTLVETLKGREIRERVEKGLVR